MNKIILSVLLLAFSMSFGQKLSKTQLTDKLAETACACTDKRQLNKNNLELALGLCIIEAINKYDKDVEKHYGKNVVTNKPKMEELGYDVGLKMGLKCPIVFQFMIDKESDDEAEEAVEEEYAMISGTIFGIKAEQFITFSVKETTGKNHHFILLSNFENAFLLTDKVLKANDNVEVYFYELELYDAKLGKFVTYSVITDIIKK
ncbi:hypothetical protein ACFSX9_09945 [Flavobacterium ardleyense]|uniref:Lipoprotein n=1 Tax=Flavobacterium ardleyense TaxID=2038737 RepID=A0ABW5Z856_9FLAO